MRWWLAARDPDAPVMLYLHGARWNLTGSVTRIDRWRELGFSVLAVDYRGFGESTDVAPTEKRSYEDAEAAWDYLAKLAPGQAALHRRPFAGRGHRHGARAPQAGSRGPRARGDLHLGGDMVDAVALGLPAGGPHPHATIRCALQDRRACACRWSSPRHARHIVPFEMGERLFAAAPGPSASSASRAPATTTFRHRLPPVPRGARGSSG